jgi:hypothetical protein
MGLLGCWERVVVAVPAWLRAIASWCSTGKQDLVIVFDQIHVFLFEPWRGTCTSSTTRRPRSVETSST